MWFLGFSTTYICCYSFFLIFFILSWIVKESRNPSNIWPMDFDFFFCQISLSIAKSGWKLFWNRMFFLESLELQFSSFLLAKYVCGYHFLSYSGSCNVQCRLMERLILGGYTETKLTLCLVFELFCR